MSATDTLSAQSTGDDGQEENWEKRTVSLSGLSFLAGDLAIIGGGVIRAMGKNGNKNELGNALTGLLWAQAGVASGMYGNPKKPMQMRIHAHNLEEYLAKQGIAVPDDVKQNNDLLRDKGTGEKIERFISKHPTEVFNTIIGGAATGMVYSGSKALATKDWPRVNSLWAGLMVMAGALGGLFIKEDPDAPKKAEHGNFIDKTIAFIKEKPLRFTSTMYLLNDYFIVQRSLSEFKEFKASGGKDWRFVYPTVAAVSNILGNALLFLSSRNQLKTGFSEAQIGEFEDIAAKTILSQPPERRESVAQTVAMYMRKQHISDMPVDQLSKQILERAQKMAGLYQTKTADSQHVMSTGPALTIAAETAQAERLQDMPSLLRQ